MKLRVFKGTYSHGHRSRGTVHCTSMYASRLFVSTHRVFRATVITRFQRTIILKQIFQILITSKIETHLIRAGNVEKSYAPADKRITSGQHTATLTAGVMKFMKSVHEVVGTRT